MSKALTLARRSAADSLAAMRAVIVLACAGALILADRALPLTL